VIWFYNKLQDRGDCQTTRKPYKTHLHFVAAVQTLDDAKTRVQELGEVWPGEYVIHKEETGERFSIITSGRKLKN